MSSGFQVEVDNLRAFAAQVRRLLSDFEANAGGGRVHALSSVAGGAFGGFAEAQDLHAKYQDMSNHLRSVLDLIYDAIDDSQRKADMTATNYEEHEHQTAQTLRLSDDGWSTAPPPARQVTSSGQTTRPVAVQQPGTGTTSSGDGTW
ncbi:hypothetical protein GCM10010441_24080 [Kitasatospora paracochleata]|uniref:Excreted virulence factor EspC (Type VII ESX diderm) n=1 Tax=Kitasatospora paracochleata TaxID=58354 RepID=A0ABT1J000_9ACTN|nr:hypothetical protein [Kitasatospora paracochleata]MCP2310121.1 hypothetical protein [Kitasatospora paracochleata]